MIMDFEDVLERLGGYGKFQKMLVWIYLAPASILMPGYFMSQIFMLSAPQHTCQLPGLTDVFNLTQQDAQALRRGLVSEDNCKVFPSSAVDSSLVRRFLEYGRNDSGAWFESQGLQRVPCTEFTYDTTFYDSTASTQWDLVCERSHLPSLVFTVTSIGSAVGTLMFGSLSDRPRCPSCTLVSISLRRDLGITTFEPLRRTPFMMVTAFNASSSISCFYFLPVLELVGPKHRTSMLGIGWMSWTLGLCALPLAAYLSRSWILLGLICSASAALNFFYWKLLPESPRWLLTQNRVDEAVVILRRIAKTNGVLPPENLASDLMKVQKKLEEEKSEAVTSTLDMLRMTTVRTNFLIVTFSWIANTAAYYGLSINVTNMSGNEFVNFFLLGLVEFPACVTSWWAMEKFGRRWMNVFFQAMVSACCLGFCFVPPGAVVPGVIVLMLAKFSCTASAMVMYQQASEVMPTPVRSFALGASSSIASSFSICMPYIIYLATCVHVLQGKFGTWIPFTVILILATMGGLSCAWLPETNGFALCQTMDDANEFGRDQKFFSFNR
ncbi:unnamed protein product [Ixodes hexagonus]